MDNNNNKKKINKSKILSYDPVDFHGKVIGAEYERNTNFNSEHNFILFGIITYYTDLDVITHKMRKMT